MSDEKSFEQRVYDALAAGLEALLPEWKVGPLRPDFAKDDRFVVLDVGLLRNAQGETACKWLPCNIHIGSRTHGVGLDLKGQERDGAYAAVSGWIRNAALPFQVPGAGWCIQWIAADATRQASEEHEVIVMNGEIAVMMDKK